MKNCGSCEHARFMPNDLKQRMCKGTPPQVVLVPVGPGQAQMQYHWPVVMAADDGCSLYKAKIIIDQINGQTVD